MNRPVLVLGAGMAGIAAARALQEAGRQVVVLEARSRSGGRTYTDLTLGLPVDLGAAWIHGPNGNPLTPLARLWGVAMAPTDFADQGGGTIQAHAADGTLLAQPGYAQGLQLAQGALAHAMASLLWSSPGLKAASMAELYDHGLPPATLTAAQEPGYRYWSQLRAQYSDAADLAEIDWRLGNDYVKLPGGDLLVYGGYNEITGRLAEGLDIRTGRPARLVVHDEGGVVVTAGAARYQGEALIVTLPLGVLKAGDVVFQPALPARKRAAIARMGFGLYEKLALRFDRFYWPETPQQFHFLDDQEPPLFSAWLNLGHYTGEPVITVSHAGSRAARINALEDGELIDRARTVMGRMFGALPPQPTAYARTRWGADPFSRGSYSFGRVGQQPGDRTALAAPVGRRLFFAGEATHPFYYGTVHGAYESGLHAAHQLQERLG